MTEKDRYLTTKEAAELMGVAPGTLRNMRSKGNGPPYVKRSAKWLRYLRSDLIAWMEEGRVEQAAG